jgi:hypothetical protein
MGVTPDTATTAVLAPTTGPGGLTDAEAAARRPHRPRPRASRSYASIVRANVFTLFNLILASFAVITLWFGDGRDVFFLAILVVGFVYEWKKGALDWE